MFAAPKERVRLAVLLVLVTLFYALTLRDGHRWGDDFAMYLHHAANLAGGVPYTATGYLFNPDVAMAGPSAYPPGLPALMAPVYLALGLNLTALKLELLILNVIALAVLYFLLEGYLGPAWRLFLIAMLAFNAQAWDAKDDIISEPPFLLFLFLSLLLLRRAYAASVTPGVLRGLGAGAAIGAACAVRNPAAALAATPVFWLGFRLLADWKQKGGGAAMFRARTLLPFTLAATLTGSLCWWLQYRLCANAAFVGGMFSISVGRARANLLQVFNGGTLRTFWLNGFSNTFSKFLYVVFLLLIVWGLIRFLRAKAGPIEAFCLAYTVLLAFYFGVDYRLALPIYPFLLAYALMGFRDLAARLAPAPRRLAIGLAILCVFATEAGAYRLKDWGPIREGIGDQDFIAVCDRVREVSAATDPVVFRKPRLLSLLTGRPSAVYTLSSDPEKNRRFFDRIQAAYVVRSFVLFDNSDDDGVLLAPLLEKYPGMFREVYRNPHYCLYRVSRGTSN